MFRAGAVPRWQACHWLLSNDFPFVYEGLCDI